MQQGCIISQRKTGCLRLRLFCCFGVCLRKSARSAGDFGVSIEYSCVIILPQIAQRNTAKLYYIAEKDRLFKIKAVLLFWGFICVNLRDLRETLGFLLSTLACYSPADIADDAEECSKLHYPAEKDRLFEAVAVIAVLLFWVSSA